MRSYARLGALGFSAAAATALAVASACSLGLDPSLFENDGSIGEGGADGGPDAPNPVQCKTDPDCKPANACLTGHCDTGKGQCVYVVCPTQACNASTCDPNLHTCSVPSAYGFHAGTFNVALGSAGCGGARRCFTAVYPFVFVGTTNGVVAFAVDNPTSGAPAAVPVAGLPFFPSSIVASGGRVYFVGGVVGAGPDYKIPIAWLDVPTDPTVAEMAATTVFDTLPLPAVDAVYPDTTGGIYLVRADGGKSWPAARVTAPLKDLDTITFAPTTGLPSGSGTVAASGSRLVTFRQDNTGSFDTFFSLETSAGTGSAQNAGEQSLLPTFGQSAGLNYLAQTPTGGLLWSASSIDAPDGGSPTTVSARVSWVLADQNATKFDATTHVDVNTYNIAGANTDLPGPVAWLDDNTALVVSAWPTNQAQSIVQLASRSGTPSVVPNRSFQLAFHPSELAATSSNGFGYVLAPNTTTSPASLDVHIFAAACTN